jgi:hypothetical protein
VQRAGNFDNSANDHATTHGMDIQNVNSMANSLPITLRPGECDRGEGIRDVSPHMSAAWRTLRK